MRHLLRDMVTVGFIVILTPATASALEGVVVDMAGKPVTGAEVFAYASRTEPEEPLKARSGDDGRFTFDLPEPLKTRPWMMHSWEVMAHKDGYAPGGLDLRSTSEHGASLRIVLTRAQPFSVRVVDPEGRTLAGARVSLSEFASPHVAIHRSLRDRVLATTDRQGNASLGFVPPDVRFGLSVESPGFGTQSQWFPLERKDRVCRLKPVGRLEGQVVAPDPAAAKNRWIDVYSASGTARVQTDDRGRFVVSRMAEGNATVTVQIDRQLPYRGVNDWSGERFKVDAGKTTVARIELVQGIQVGGQITDADTAKPIAGGVVYVSGQTVVTDAKGRYQALVGPGRVFASLRHVPGLYLIPSYTTQTVDLKAGAPPHEFPPYRLSEGIALSGRVVDERGRGVAGARIRADWRWTRGAGWTIGSQHAESDEDGRFVVKPLQKGQEVAFAAETDDRATESTLRVPPGSKKPVTLKVTPAGAATLTGRVLSEDGRPVAGAHVRFLRARRIPSGRIMGSARVTFFGRDELLTDADGAFRTPIKLPRSEQYALRIVAEGMTQQQTKYLKLDPTAVPVRLDEIVLQRELSLAGRVVDAEGRPVEGATVWSHGHVPYVTAQSTSVQTAKDGRFHLKTLHPGARFALVQKQGYRFTGAVIPKTGELRVELESADAPPVGKPLRSLRRTRDQRHKLLRELMLPIYPKLLAGGGEYFATDILKRLAAHDAKFVLEQLENIRRDTNQVDVLIAAGEIDDALGCAATLENPYSIAFKYLAAADAAKDAKRKKEIVVEALVHARRIEKPDRRVRMLGEVSEHLVGLGDRKAARKVLDEGRKLATKLAPSGWNGFARGRFAETLALFEPEEARKLVQDLKDASAFMRHVGNIAHELAEVNPAEAERFLGMIERDNRITPYAVRVCYRMARADLPRARRIADALVKRNDADGLVHRAHAYGVMAMGVAAKHPKIARELLRTAFEQLNTRRPLHISGRRAFPVAVALVRYSETVDPAATREYFWRAVAAHPGLSGHYFSPDDRLERMNEQTANLVILLGLYDQCPQVRRELMAPVFVHWGKYKNRKQMNFYRQHAVFTAMALTDPQQTIRWHQGFHPKLSKEDLRLIPQPWMTIADVFGGSDVDLGRRVCQEVFHLWVIDKED